MVVVRKMQEVNVPATLGRLDLLYSRPPLCNTGHYQTPQTVVISSVQHQAAVIARVTRPECAGQCLPQHWCVG